ncbi:MAG: cysteine desulfurase family protein, partial [Candidatus Oleimicrobiaceae bacterium]
MQPYLTDIYGNPSSLHGIGRKAKVALEEHREKLAKLWGCKSSEVIFTSSGTEANSLAIIGTALAAIGKGKHLIASAIEHTSVLKPILWLEEHLGFYSTIVRTDASGFIDPKDIAHALRKDTVLVSIGAANNEIGTIQNLLDIARIVRDEGVPLHTDATQLLGKVPVHTLPELGADLVSCCAHKLFGPKGAGVLYVRSPLKLKALITGGGQEKELRAGTENLAAIAGLVAALEKNTRPPCFDQSSLAPLSEYLKDAVTRTSGVQFWGPDVQHRLANTLTFSVNGTNSQT